MGKLPVNAQPPVIIDTGALLVTDPMVAEIIAEPCDTPVTRPVVGPTVATDDVSESQLAVVVTAFVVPSEKVPVAMSCWLIPTPVVIGFGVIAIDLTTAPVTLSVTVPVTDPELAVIVVEPMAKAVASPEVLMVAIPGVPEVQTTVVKSAVLESENFPVAVSCCVSPIATLGVLGVTDMDNNWRIDAVEPVLPPPPHEASRAEKMIETTNCAGRPIERNSTRRIYQSLEKL